MQDPGGRKAGFISKPYGLHGKVHLILQQGTGLIIEKGDPLFIDIDGQRVPFFVEEIDTLAVDQALVDFEFIDTLEEARKISGCEVFFDPSRSTVPKKPGQDLANLVGYRAMDRDKGDIGTITGYMPHELNPIFMVQRGEREILIPVNEDLISGIDPARQIIYFELPEGLIQL